MVRLWKAWNRSTEQHAVSDSNNSTGMKIKIKHPEESESPSGNSSPVRISTSKSPTSAVSPIPSEELRSGCSSRTSMQSFISHMNSSHAEMSKDLPTRFAAAANLAALLVLLVGELLHHIASDVSPSTCAIVVAVLYFGLCLLLLSVVLGEGCGQHTRLLIVTFHVAVGVASICWHLELDGSKAHGASSMWAAALAQLLVVMLYPTSLLCALMMFSILAVTFVIAGLLQSVPSLGVAHGIVSLAAASIAAVAAQPAKDDAVMQRMALLAPGLGLSAWDSAGGYQNGNDISTMFEPIMDESASLFSPSEDPQITTRLDRLVHRLLATKDNIYRSSIDADLRKMLLKVFNVLLREMKNTSSLYALPTAELSGASQMMTDYVTKILNQNVDAPLVVLSPDDPTPRTSTTLTTFKEKEETSEETAHSASYSYSSEREGTTPALSQEVLRGRESAQSTNLSEGSFDLTFSRASFAEASVTFDESITNMMTPLVFCEHFDELPAPCLGTSVQEMLQKDLGTWRFDVFKLCRLCENRPLVVTGRAAMSASVQKLALNEAHLLSFLEMIEARYHSTNLYHNSMHAADVLNNVFYFLKLRSAKLASLDQLECLSVLVAASAHDVGHDGRANRFHVSTGGSLALLYNDQSCQENMHCTLTFGVLQAQACNFLANLEAPQRASVRSLIVKQILDTDLAKHIESVGRFRQEFLNNVETTTGAELSPNQKPVVLSPNQRKELLSFTLKCADVSHSTKPFDLHSQWTLRINAEFFAQGDVEKSLGLPCSPFCDRNATNVAESQRGFFDFIVKPLYTALDECLDCRRLRVEVLPELDQNCAFWKGWKPTSFNYENAMANTELLRTAFRDRAAMVHESDAVEEEQESTQSSKGFGPIVSSLLTPASARRRGGSLRVGDSSLPSLLSVTSSFPRRGGSLRVADSSRTLNSAVSPAVKSGSVFDSVVSK